MCGDVMLCDMSWCVVMWCVVMWPGVMWCILMWCVMMCHDVVWCVVMWSDMLWCSVRWCVVLCCIVMWCGVYVQWTPSTSQSSYPSLTSTWQTRLWSGVLMACIQSHRNMRLLLTLSLWVVTAILKRPTMHFITVFFDSRKRKEKVFSVSRVTATVEGRNMCGL